MALLQDRVSQPIALEERIHPAALHEWLREATTAVLTGARPAPSGDLPRPPWLPEAAPETQSGGTPAEPEFYRISDPLQPDTFVGSQCPELDMKPFS